MIPKTAENRQAAVEKVEPVRIKQGQIIVEENQLINPDIYRQLQLAGLLNNKRIYSAFCGISFADCDDDSRPHLLFA